LGDLLKIKQMDMDCTQILGEIDTNRKFMRTRKTRVTFSEGNCMERERLSSKMEIPIMVSSWMENDLAGEE